jgi:excisionase family DNA binding protein
MYGSRPVKPNGTVYAHHGESLLLTVEEAAALLRIGRSRVYDLIASGEIESVKIGGSRRVPRDAAEAYVRRLVAEQGADPAA